MKAIYEFEEREINIILKALAKEPYQDVFILIAKIQNNFNEQNKTELLNTENDEND